MIRGMTGFGSSQISSGKWKGLLEIKTQNHRYFDIAFFLPVGFSSIEEKVKKYINRTIKRGRIIVSLKIVEKITQKISFNKEAVKEYLRYAKVLKKECGLEDNLTIADLIKLPGVVCAREETISPLDLWPVIEKSLIRAIYSVNNMRQREGKSLYLDISGVLKRMSAQVNNIKARAREILKEKKKELSLEEFSSFQRSNDINEEIARLAHYIEEFKHLMQSDVMVGKNLDFVAQEMQRETNTIGAKLQDKVVSNAVVAIKSKIEKLREQAQNIE